MKVLALSLSPRRNGNTEALLKEALAGAQSEGAEVELYSVSGKKIAPCDACDGCSKTGKCHIKDDMPEVYARMLEADAIIFGTPVYYYNMTAQAKAVIDRTIALSQPEESLANKVAAMVVTGGSLGLVSALKDFYFYAVTRQMIPANFVAAYGDTKKLEKGTQAARSLGRQVVKIAAQGFKYPPEIGRSLFAYGTHTR